jgi:hypothetical protein
LSDVEKSIMYDLTSFRLFFCWCAVLALLAGGALAEPPEERLSDSAEARWDVSIPHIPSDTLQFETIEGTWITVDVSPDGREIVFDLLGDIYKMPITGGDATLLSGGLPYEVQPRFSSYTMTLEQIEPERKPLPQGPNLEQVANDDLNHTCLGDYR